MTKIIEDVNVKYIKIILLKKIIRKVINLLSMFKENDA